MTSAASFFSGNAEDTAGTYHLGGRYEFTPDLMVFASYATGYKGQTYDLTTGFNANRAAAGPIKPERSRDWELGARMQFLDRRVTANLTLFNTDYENLQAQTIETLADGTTNFRLTNVGGLNTKGVEFGPWIRRFVAQVKRNWLIPYAAMSMKGHVVVTFNVHKDGTISDLQVVGASPVGAFNNAAYGALASSNPTAPLPPESDSSVSRPSARSS